MLDKTIKAKAHEMLILRSLGLVGATSAKYFLFIRLYYVLYSSLLALHWGSCRVVNQLHCCWSGMFVMFVFDPLVLLILLFAVLAVNAMALLGGIFGMSDKNLRKAFQKAKL